MVYRKKTPTKKTYKKKPYARITKPISYKRANIRQDKHIFKRWCSVGSYGITTPGIARGFRLSDLPGYGDFTSLFDQYRITHIKLTFYKSRDPAAATPGYSQYPVMFICNDHDDTVAPASVAVMLEHGKCKQVILHPAAIYEHHIKPAVVQDGLVGASGGKSVQWDKWIDCADPGVNYYGVKWFIENWYDDNDAINVRAEYTVELRATR